jgi:transcription elongation factor GreB
MINYITPLGFKRLQDEYSFLKKSERPKITALVSWAASLGDRSENADYIYGKKRLREIDRRVRFLSKRIESAQVVDPEKQTSESIKFGATVCILALEGDEKPSVYQIVGVDEFDTKLKRISWRSPIANALIGKIVGDQVSVSTPKGERDFEVISFKYLRIEVEEFLGVSENQC